jgi:hypothetical protein
MTDLKNWSRRILHPIKVISLLNTDFFNPDAGAILNIIINLKSHREEIKHRILV